MKQSNDQQGHSLGAQVYVVLYVLTLIRERKRTGTQEIRQALAQKGLIYSQRTIQRWLSDAKTKGIPLCCDENVPRGWWWNKDISTDVAIIETIQVMREAA